MRITKLPLNSQQTHILKGIAGENSRHCGQTIKGTIHEAQVSLGYKSNYDHIRAVFLTIWINGQISVRKRYTGKNIRHAFTNYRDIREFLNTITEDKTQ